MTVQILATFAGSLVGSLLGYVVLGGAYRELRRDRKRFARLFRDAAATGRPSVISGPTTGRSHDRDP